jgi:MFS family permease
VKQEGFSHGYTIFCKRQYTLENSLLYHLGWTGYLNYWEQLVQFALIWYLTVQTGSATVLATASLVGLLPNVILGPFIGTLVDRWDRRRIMLVSDTVIMLVTIGLAVLFALDAVEVWHIYVVMFISGMVLIWRAALHSNGHMRVVYPCGNANRITRYYHAG